MNKNTKFGKAAARPAREGLFVVTPREVVLSAVVIAGCIGLHFPAIHQRFAWTIEIGLSLLSFATPISGMLYLSASQVIPDPVNQPIISSSMMAIAGFFIWRLRGSPSGWLKSGLPLLKAVAPYFLWCAAMTLMRGETYFSKRMAYAIITGCVAAALLVQSRNRLMTCLLAFLIGQAIAATVFWMIKLGFGSPVQTFDTDVYGASTVEALRFGTARGNATALGPSMALVAIGVIAHWLIFPAERSMRGWLTRIVGLGFFLIVVPPLIASGCRGAIIATGCSVIFLFVGGLVSRQALLASPLLIGAGALLVVLCWSQFGLDKSWEFMVHRQRVDTEEGGSVVAGRQNEWKAAALGVLDSPIMGGGHVELLSYQDDPSMWASHNTYLDGGLSGGLPGMVFFIWFVSKPLIGLWHRRRDFVVGCFLSIYLMNAIVIATTSAAQVKDLWILWGLAAAWFAPSLAEVPMERKSKRMKFKDAFRARSGGYTSAPTRKVPHLL